MAGSFEYQVGKAVRALELPEHYVWDCSVIQAEGKYHMFSSRWEKTLGFGWNWLFHSQIIHGVADRPEGPYRFQNVVLDRRGREYFDGMNTHNTCIRQYQGKFYLYYMGCTYGGPIPEREEDVGEAYALETWNRKRIGLAVAERIDGPYVRRDAPLLEPRDCRFWDCTITTNPSVAILPDGKTYMMYKSRTTVGGPLQLGMAVADSPEGPFRRLSDEPILQFADENCHVEDPCFWYDARKERFCLIAKDDSKNGAYGITGQWGGGFYGESRDAIHWEIPEDPTVYTRSVQWQDGHVTLQGNLERPWLLFDEAGRPTHLFCATGEGEKPYQFNGNTYILCMTLEDRE